MRWFDALVGDSHPDDRTLNRYADDALPARAAQTVAAHLASCTRCRGVVSAVHRLGDAVRAIEVPTPALSAGRERVLARRAAGERVILPVASGSEDRARSPDRAPMSAASAIDTWTRSARLRVAAALLLGAIGGGAIATGATRLADSGTHRREPAGPSMAILADASLCDAPSGGDLSIGDSLSQEDSMSAPSIRQLLMHTGLASLVGPFLGCAGDVVTAPPAQGFDVSRVRPMALEYRLLTVLDTFVVARSERSFRLARGVEGGQPMWVVVGDTDLVPVATAIDSTYFRLADLRPVRQLSMRGAGHHVLISLAGDRGTIHFDHYRNRNGDPWTTFDSQVTLVRTPGVSVGPVPVEMALSALPLARGWSGSVAVLPFTCLLCSVTIDGLPHFRSDAPLTQALQVVGEGRVTVPAGTFDCWRVISSLHAASGGSWSTQPSVLWVSKDTHVIVREAYTSRDPDGDTYVHSRELVRADLGT